MSKRLLVPPITSPLHDGKNLLVPRWVKWFNDVQAFINGDALPKPAAVTVSASPFVYKYNGANAASLIVSGGTVSAIALSRDLGTTYYSLGQTSGMFQISPGDWIQVTYTVAPTMTTVLR